LEVWEGEGDPMGEIWGSATLVCSSAIREHVRM